MQGQSAVGRLDPSGSRASTTGGATDWRAAHDRVVHLAKSQAGMDYEQGVALLAALRSEVHLRLGFGSFHEYVDRQMGYSPRQAWERLRVARALEQLPQLTQALRDGQTSWSVVRELTRVATSETEREWLQAAANKTVRAVEQLVSGHGFGSLPDDPSDDGARRQVLRFEVSADVAATFREAVAELGRQAGGRLDDEDVLLALARTVLVGPRDMGRASYQIALTVCERCGRGSQQGGGTETEVAPEVIEMARCDAQDVGAVGRPAGGAPRVHDDETQHDGAGAPNKPGSHGGRARAETQHDAAGAPNEPDAHGGRARTETQHDAAGAPNKPGTHGGTGEPDVHGAQESADARHDSTHRAAPEHRVAPQRRAAQSVPPATRRLVWRRDRGTCVVSGCQNCRFCDVHHLTPREEGGAHDPSRLVVLCSAHHRAVHDGRLIIDGSVAGGLVFRHADGTRYGASVSPIASDVYTKVFNALRRLGYPETETKRALGRVRAHVGTSAQVTDERVLREALSVLAA